VNYDAFTFKVLEIFLTIIFIIKTCKIYGFHYLIASLCILYQ
jgi:hypothetical protein